MPITVSPSGGAQGAYSTYTPIYSTTLSSTATSVTFSNIPQDYTDLTLVVNGSFNATEYLNLQFNGDTGSNYSDLPLRGSGSTVGSGGASNRAFIWTNLQATNGTRFICRSTILNYSNASFYKTAMSRADALSDFTSINIGTWKNTSPITSIRAYCLSGNSFNSGTTFTIYAVRAATPAPKATGGQITTDGSYWYHAFRTSGVFEPTQAVTADILVVAGGGPGGPYAGGGGGAGGVLGFASQSLTANTSYTCLVGAGGGGAYNGQPSPKGNDSRFGSLTLVKGGGFGKNGGGVLFSEYENSGGSSGGGGGSGNAGQRTPQSATSGQGYSGGTANSSDSAGGGGAGAVGGGATGAGGAGATYNTSIGGVSGPFSFINPMGFATGIGHYSGGNWYFGGGGSPAYTSNITGGVGGGGSGAAYNVQGNVTTRGTDGTANTGGGGGGGGASNNDATTRAMSGGSGVIIVRYAV